MAQALDLDTPFSVPPRSVATFPSSVAPFTVGQLQQLQWVLPTPFTEALVTTLKTQRLAGAKLSFTHAGDEHWWEVFDAERMLSELLHEPAFGSSRRDTLLPLAGCGRQRTTLYSVDVTDLGIWRTDAGATPVALGLDLREALTTAQPEPRARARRRLPQKLRPSLAKAGTARRKAARVPAPCDRTLLLFG